MKRILFILTIVVPGLSAAQHYTAANGSSFTGSLNVHNNPASIVNTPFRWDMALLGVQDKHSTNAIKVFKYSLLSNPAGSEYAISNGRFKRHGDLNFSANLLNTRIALNKRSAIAFGANIRSYTTLRTSSYYFYDTLHVFGDFFKQNITTGAMSLEMASSSWAELYASYGRTILDNEFGRLNAGLTVKLNRGLSGAFATLANGRFVTNASVDPVEYRITDAALEFGYSSNYDRWDSARKFRSNSREFFSFTEGGGSFDIGVEYLVKLQSAKSFNDEDIWFDYNWKIGLSVLDIGYGQYHFGKYSTRAISVRPGVTDVVLDQAFDSTIQNLGDFRDSLSAVFDRVATFGGKFRVAHPTRLVLNIDKFINGAFYVNANLSIHLASLGKDEGLAVKAMELLTLTPRWETRKKGFFLPIYYNSRNQLWVGGAIRIGPLLFGVHNWSNIFSRKKFQRGGGYLAILLRPSAITGDKSDRRLDCYW